MEVSEWAAIEEGYVPQDINRLTTYEEVAERGEGIQAIIPPHVTAVLSDEAGTIRLHNTSTFLWSLHWEGGTGMRRPTTADALWLKPRWADTRP